MAHWYLNKKRFDENHPRWGKDPWPKNPSGSPKARINDIDRVNIGAVKGVTDILKIVGAGWWMPRYFGNMGIEAGMRAERDGHDAIAAADSLNRLTNAPAERGTRIHAWLEHYLNTGKLPDDEAGASACKNVGNFLEQHELLENSSKELVVMNEGVYRYGGTADLVQPHSVTMVDFKSVDKPRDARFTECAQLVAYGVAEFPLVNIEDMNLCNLYIHQKTGEILNPNWWLSGEKEEGWELFKLAYKIDDIFTRRKS